MKLVVFFCFFMFSLQGFSDEILHAQSLMEKVESTYVIRSNEPLTQNCFKNASNIEVSVFKNGEERVYSSVDISWDVINPRTREIATYERHLEVYDHYSNKDNIGTVVARLPKVTDPDDPAFGVRFSIILTDYTTYKPTTGPNVAYKWQAKVRSGNGWCSSSDARMTIRGNPTVFDE